MIDLTRLIVILGSSFASVGNIVQIKSGFRAFVELLLL